VIQQITRQQIDRTLDPFVKPAQPPSHCPQQRGLANPDITFQHDMPPRKQGQGNETNDPGLADHDLPYGLFKAKGTLPPIRQQVFVGG
jgi:hypothetical protein